MARLTEPQKQYIVQRLACFEGAAQVQREVKELWGIDLSLQAIAHYDPDVPSTRTPKKWKEIFDATRKAYLEAAAEVGIAQPRWRLERLQVLYDRAASMGTIGNIPLALQVLEQAAKETGGAFTNRHRHEVGGRDGGPIEHRDLTHDELLELAREQARRVTELANDDAGDGAE